jgi:hypothetical protein
VSPQTGQVMSTSIQPDRRTLQMVKRVLAAAAL